MPLPEAIIISITIFAAIFFTTYFIYQHALYAQVSELKEGLIRTAKVIATTIDGDAHKTFTQRSQENTPEYKHAILPMAKALKADDTLSYVYTIILKNSKPYFILDPTPTGDADHDGVDDKSHIMQVYKDADEEMMQALTQHIAHVMKHPERDAWGTFLSAYAPFYDSKGSFVGIVGVDITADNYFARLAPIKRATIRTMVTGFFISFLIGSLVWFTRNFSLQLNNKRWKVFCRLSEQPHIHINIENETHQTKTQTSTIQ